MILLIKTRMIWFCQSLDNDNNYKYRMLSLPSDKLESL